MEIRYTYTNDEGEEAAHIFCDDVWNRFELDGVLFDDEYLQKRYSGKTEDELKIFLGHCGFTKENNQNIT